MEPLLKLADGNILSFEEDNTSYGGCETCDYGSSYIQEFTVKTTQGDIVFKVDNMYEFAVSHQFMFTVLLPNVEAIKAMTIAEFVTWLEAKLNENGSFEKPIVTVAWPAKVSA